MLTDWLMANGTVTLLMIQASASILDDKDFEGGSGSFLIEIM